MEKHALMKHLYAASPVARHARLFTLALAAAASTASAEMVFDFESTAHETSARVEGDKFYFDTSSDFARSGSNSLRFVDPAAEPYENFTYDVPFDTFTSGVISVWFYDTRGTFNTGHGTPVAGGSIILEDADNPQDFVAMEVLSFPYGKDNVPAYYATEGTIDRLKASDRFDSSNMANRSVGFHKVEFHVSASDTRIYVDGTTSLEVAGPGSASKLRLRFMADSPSNGGNALNWITGPRAATWFAGGEWVYFDDINFARELPTADIHSHGFELAGGQATYDSAGTPGSPGSPGVPPNDNEHMAKFVNQWDVSTSATAAHSGAQSAFFANATPALKSLTFDLEGVTAGTSATLYFYDALGQNVDFDKNNSIIIENANNPAEFLAVEINNWPYPYSSGVQNYYVTKGIPGDPATAVFESGALPARSVGWHKVEIGFYATHSLIAVDDKVGFISTPATLAQGPGVDKPLRLRLMADGASQGGFSNWTAVNELTALYHISDEPYVYYDDITLPVTPSASVGDWQMY